MRRLVYLLSAQHDLNDIFRYIAREAKSRAVGEAFVRSLRQQGRNLASLPGRLGNPDRNYDPIFGALPSKAMLSFPVSSGSAFAA